MTLTPKQMVEARKQLAQENGKLGGAARAKNMTKAQRKAAMQQVIAARWAGHVKKDS